jgi:hypothetical protein
LFSFALRFVGSRAKVPNQWTIMETGRLDMVDDYDTIETSQKACRYFKSLASCLALDPNITLDCCFSHAFPQQPSSTPPSASQCLQSLYAFRVLVQAPLHHRVELRAVAQLAWSSNAEYLVLRQQDEMTHARDKFARLQMFLHLLLPCLLADASLRRGESMAAQPSPAEFGEFPIEIGCLEEVLGIGIRRLRSAAVAVVIIYHASKRGSY